MVSAAPRPPRPAIAGDDHPVRLQGLGVSQRPGEPIWGSGTARPSLCERQDQDVVQAILRELSAGQWPNGMLSPGSPQAELTLRQPVHRCFTLALLEAVCDPWGQPLLQPRLQEGRLHSAGLVVRRLVNGSRQGWRSQEDPRTGRILRGWIAFNGSEEEDHDPDPSLRAQPAGRHPELERRLLPQPTALSESSSGLFQAPPAVAAATGRTVLYGLVPLTSLEYSEGPLTQAAALEGQNQAEILAALPGMLPWFLREGPALPGPSPRQGAPLRLRASDLEPNSNGISLAATDPRQAVVQAVQQLVFQFRAMESAALMREFGEINLDAGTAQSRSLATFLQQAEQVLIERRPDQTLVLPVTWGAISPERHQRLLSLLAQQLQAQLQLLSSAAARFEGSEHRYQMRAFMRLRRSDGCPPKIIWSDYSNPFTIAPWYQASNAPPIRIELPDVLDPQTLRSLRPNVTFRVPPRLFKLLGNRPEDLLKGIDKQSGSSDDQAWLCGFNIPIISICAFLVLNIFLTIFNLIFWWIFIIKICIPLPRSRPSPPP
jgi:hypothetical protein